MVRQHGVVHDADRPARARCLQTTPKHLIGAPTAQAADGIRYPQGDMHRVSGSERGADPMRNLNPRERALPARPRPRAAVRPQDEGEWLGVARHLE